MIFHLKFQVQRLLRKYHNNTHQFAFGQAKSWQGITLHSFCIKHEKIFEERFETITNLDPSIATKSKEPVSRILMK